MGFPLPANPNVTEFAYYLVAIPDAPEYRQAVKGHLGELGFPSKWGLEGIESGSYVAAQAWLRAIDETWRLLEMGWPDLVISHIDDIETLLSALQLIQQVDVGCCENVSPVDPPGGGSSSEPVPQPVIDAGYATGSSDYEGYNSYKCMAAHLFLNNQQANVQALAPLVAIATGIASVILLLFGWYHGIAALTLGGLTVGFGDILVLVDILKDLTAGDLTIFAGDLEEHRDELVCAIVQADGIDDSWEAYANMLDTLFVDAEALVLKNINGKYMMQTILYGEHGGANVVDQYAALGYDPAEYTCCEEEPPEGYEIVPVAYTGTCTGSGCTGVSAADNVVTFTNWTSTAGARMACTNPGTVVGAIHLAAINSSPIVALGSPSCTDNDIISNQGTLLASGYNFAFTATEHANAFAAYMALHTPNVSHGNAACTPPTSQVFKHNAAGSISGTVTSWHIKTV